MSRRQRPLCRFPELDPDAQQLMRDIVAACVRSQRIPALMKISEREAVQSVIKLIERGHLRLESFEDADGDEAYRLAPVGGGRNG